MTRLDTLKIAVRTAIRNQCPRSAISVPHWSATYKLSPKIIRETWESELTKHAPNSAEIGEGK
jgi:hypothetical protein